MSNKQHLREQAIINAAKNCGYPVNQKDRLISFWELAGELNNTWNAPLFVNKKHCAKRYLDGLQDGKKWAVNYWTLQVYRRMILWTIRRMKNAEIMTKGYPMWFSIPVK